MISAGLAVDGHTHGLGLPGHHPYMTYPEPWRGGAPPPPTPKHSTPPCATAATEFLRPAPKPLQSTRYNGSLSAAGALNGARLVTGSSRTGSKYPSPPGPGVAAVGPVNLTHQVQHQSSSTIKEEPSSGPTSEDLSVAASYSAAAAAYSRLYQQHSSGAPSAAAAAAAFSSMHYPTSLPGPYGALYPAPYTPLIRTSYVQPPPLSPLDTYSPPTSTASSATFGSPTVPSVLPHHPKPAQSVLRSDKRPSAPTAGFKVPSGKEGSLKHRILTRPPGEGATVHGASRRRLGASTLSPPATPGSINTPSPLSTTNNNTTVPGNFSKGSLIQLANGELRRIEDMRTEDFVLSAEKSPELRLAESTVVRIHENPVTGTAVITLSYNQNRTQVDFDTIMEHPFFVYGQGWASCNPERTLQCYGLKVHRLQVGDILVSLTPREPAMSGSSVSNNSSSGNKSSTITTTATTTAMTARQVSRTNVTATGTTSTEHQVRTHFDKTLLPPPPPAPICTSHEPLDVSSNSRKRRWSAPDQICDDEEQATRRHKE